jgi:dTDP-4-amino-4,6-dideoxygalactose transaminase
MGQEFHYLENAIRRGQLSGDGYYTRACNARIEALTGSETALLTHSCTAALEMAAILCDLKPGDEVIMPSFTFVSTANAVVLRGAVPVFVDIDAQSLNLDPGSVRAAVTPRTKAIFAVHYAGFPADMATLAHIADTHGLLLVEDAAQALGSTYRGQLAGSLGDMAAFSFHETKNIISGEGGALTINRPELVERAEIIREKGTNRSRFMRNEVDKYTWVDVGSSFLPGELVAAFLYAQLEQSDSVLKRRQAMFQRYCDAFSSYERQGRVRCPVVPADTTGNGHMFYLMMRSRDDRDACIAHLRSKSINAVFHYVPLHSAPAGLRYTRADGDLPVTDQTSDCLMRLPMFYALEDQVHDVIEAVYEYLQGRHD